MVGVIIVENFCAGLVVAGFGAFFMSLCSPRFSATQYALMFFLITIAAGLPAMLLLPVFAPWNETSPYGARQ